MFDSVEMFVMYFVFDRFILNLIVLDSSFDCININSNCPKFGAISTIFTIFENWIENSFDKIFKYWNWIYFGSFQLLNPLPLDRWRFENFILFAMIMRIAQNTRSTNRWNDKNEEQQLLGERRIHHLHIFLQNMFKMKCQTKWIINWGITWDLCRMKLQHYFQQINLAKNKTANQIVCTCICSFYRFAH